MGGASSPTPSHRVDGGDPFDHPSFDEAGLGMAYASLTGQYLRVNRRFCEMLDYREDELLARSFYDVGHAEDRGPTPDERARLLAGEIPWFRLRRRYARRDGSPVWARLTVSVRRDAAGQPLHYVDVVEEITEQVIAERERDALLGREAAARAEAEELTVLVSAAASGGSVAATIEAALAAVKRLMPVLTCDIALPDADGVLRLTSGLPSHPPVGPLYAFRPGEGLVGRAYAHGQLQRTDDLPVDPRSHQPDLDVQLGIRAYLAAPLIAHGRVLGVITAGSPVPAGFADRDAELLARIADHVAIALAAEQSRQALRSEAAQKAAIIEQMGDGVLVFDRAGRVVLANTGAAELVGAPVESLIGLTPESYPWAPIEVVGEPFDPGERRIWLILEGKHPERSEARIRRRDGTERWVDLSSSRLVDEDGQTIGAVVVGRDVTARREAERASEQARERETQSEKLRALGQMASGVAHNVNQVLALIVAHADLAVDAVAARSPDLAAARASIGTIARAALDGGETIKRLLTFARGQAPVSLDRAIEVADLLREVAELTAPRWRDEPQAQGRPIVLDLAAPAGLLVRGRSTDLCEALTNLVFNAVDALPAGGRVRLAARRVGTDRVEIEVADDGVGMSPETRARLFEPFFTTKGDHGTGLGLPMVFAIVQQHGGTIDIRSTLGCGTSFLIGLPAFELAGGVAPGGEEPAAEERTRPLRVLLVDDEPLLRSAVEALLRRDGHEVRAVVDGERALEQLDQAPVDLVVSDLAMGPGINGLALARRVRARWPTTRFVLCSGLASTVEVDEARASGVHGLLPKPYASADLRRVVADLARELAADQPD